MKKLFKACLAVAMAATLVACGGSASAKFAKVGLGVVSSWSDGQANTTFVALGLDADGKIQYIDLDVAQSTPGTAEKTETKEELKEGYGMKTYSSTLGNIENGGEWYEQAEAFEKWCIGKTPADVVAVATTEVNGHMVAKDEADLYAGCTIQITDFQKAVEKAAANAVAVEAESVVLGRYMTNGDAEVDTTLTMFALDADGKVVLADLEVAQISDGVTDTKTERGDSYGMKTVSGYQGNIEGGAEWYEQAEAFEKWCVGKTVAEIAALETTTNASGYVVAADADLYAGCTIKVADFIAAAAKAK